MAGQNTESYKILIVALPQRLNDYILAFQADGDPRFPFDVQTTSDQAVVKELLEAINFDLVLLEYNSSTEENELQLLAWIKEQQPKTMALILTADENIASRDKAFELGAFDWVVTGQRGQVSVDYLLRRVKDAILYKRFEEGIFELKANIPPNLWESPRKVEVGVRYEPIIVDVLDGHVSEIEGNVVYAKYLIAGEEHQAAFDIALFQEAAADFQGAQVRFLTLKTDDESSPYDLKVELKGEQTLNPISGEVHEKLDRLEQFDNFRGIRQ